MALYKHSKKLEILKERDMLYNIVENKDNTEYIFVKSKSRLIKLNTNDVVYIEALKDYVVINTPAARSILYSLNYERYSEKKCLKINF